MAAAYYQLQHRAVHLETRGIPRCISRDPAGWRHRVCRLISLPYLGLLPAPPYNLTGERNFPKILEIPRSCVSEGGGDGRRTVKTFAGAPANAGETVLDSCLCKTRLLSELMEYRAVSWNLPRSTY